MQTRTVVLVFTIIENFPAIIVSIICEPNFSFCSGPNDNRFGPRFFPTNDLYNKKYRDIGKQVSQSI